MKRLIQNPLLSRERRNRVLNAGNNYMNVITSSKSYQSMAKRLYKAYENSNFNDVRRLNDMAQNRQYSSNFYMGNSKG